MLLCTFDGQTVLSICHDSINTYQFVAKMLEEAEFKDKDESDGIVHVKEGHNFYQHLCGGVAAQMNPALTAN